MPQFTIMFCAAIAVTIRILLVTSLYGTQQCQGEELKCDDKHKCLDEPALCRRKRLYKATQRHHTQIFGPLDKTSTGVYLECPICENEEMTDFKWNYTERRSDLIKLSDSVYDSDEVLSLNRMKPLGKIGSDEPLLNLTVQKLGTYVCSNKNPDHPANYIWYHLDQITSEYTDVSSSVLEGAHRKIVNPRQVTVMRRRAKEVLSNAGGWSDITAGPLVVTYAISEENTEVVGCGPVTIEMYKKCFIRIPAQQPTQFPNDVLRYTYKLLRKAFSDLLNTGSKQAEVRAKNKGLDIHGNGSHLYIPCQYPLLREISTLDKYLRHGGLKNYKVRLELHLMCPSIGFEQLVSLASLKSLKNMKVHIPPLRDYRYTKVDRIVMDKTENLTLPCSRRDKMSCSSDEPDAIWKSGNMITYTSVRFHNESVYVDEDCSLKFLRVHPYDGDIYYCFLRDKDSNNTVWSKLPRIAYRVNVERTGFQWPRENDVLVGLVLLICWTLFLIVLWVVLNLYDAHLRSHAMFYVSSDRTEGRMKRIKEVYSPFSDEDEPLYKFMQEKEQ
ncbi:unnamed protein product [Calicophoron daubneyi]|uniref:Ig-like domain-containing protein n=1 Tax=Calicophoron daubneyi TaxID=300641 RepID=A0AAV2T407_CALDB